MALHNRKFGVPYIPGLPGGLPSVGSFLRGDLRTYYGPGQPPDVGEPGLYRPPGAWVAPTTALRRPQMVWLTIAVAFPYTGYASDEWLRLAIAGADVSNFGSTTPGSDWGYAGSFESDGTAVIMAIWALASPDGAHAPPANDFGGWTYGGLGPGFGGGIGGGLYPFWYQNVPPSSKPPGPGVIYDDRIPNPFPAERARLRSLADRAKGLIEALRPGRTWVQVIDPWAYDAATDNVGGVPFFGSKDTYFTNLPGEDWALMAPADPTGAFRTNFLHVYLGCPASTDCIPPPGSFPINAAQDRLAKDVTIPLTVRSWHAGPHGIRIYNPDPAVGHHPYVPLHSLAELTAMMPRGELYSGYNLYGPGEAPPDGHGTEWQPIDPLNLAGQQELINSEVTASNGSIDRMVPAMAGIHQNELGDLLAAAHDGPAVIDAKYMGGTSALVTATDLVRVVAGYYRFDPDTGEDLPGPAP